MFIMDIDCKYKTMLDLIEKSRRSSLYPRLGKSAQIGEDDILGARFLYVQSNGQILLGHDAQGRMYLVCAPGEKDYPLPTLTAAPDQLITAHPGMFYQADIAMLMGMLRFCLTLENGTELSSGMDGAVSCYLDGVLPMTQVQSRGLTLTSISVAPVLERAAKSPLPHLPGPSGAMHILHIKNESKETLKAEAHLSLVESFATNHDYRVRRPFQAEWEENLLLVWRTDVCAAIQAQGFAPMGNPGLPDFWRGITLEPGEEITLTCIVAVSHDISGINPALSALYRHSVLEWMNITLTFWEERLGHLRPLSEDALQHESVEFVRRGIIDNFNCLQMNGDGELIIHLQGAPSQVGGRFWGIDAEPTALSVLGPIPELAGPILRYIVERNRPAYSPYGDEHSTPILMAPLIIAGMYYEWTGDTAFFRREEHVMNRLLEDIGVLLDLRHESGLIPSRYSSDGHVFHRYDFGTNCKAFYSLRGVARIAEALGLDQKAHIFRNAAERLRNAVRLHMVQDGPFGPQFTGGSNMGEYEPFYLRDDMMYYDGEDSSSCMAPIYGIVSFEDDAWRNYHRFSSSLFCTNYDPEAGALRWFAWGGAVDGTALISSVGGSVTRADMASRLRNMLDFGCDETGSLFWWPKAKNWVRGLTRCSQGVGAWVVQHTVQWLGLRLDAAARTLTIQPQGLYGGYEWIGAKLGNARFDIVWEEREDSLFISVTNHNDEPYTVLMSSRPQGAVLGGTNWLRADLSPGECLARTLSYPDNTPEANVDISAVENKVCASGGLVLGTCSFELPAPFADAPNVLTMPVVLLSPQPLPDAVLELTVPDGFGLKPKRPALLDEYDRDSFSLQIQIPLGDVAPMSRRVIPLYLSLPHPFTAAWLTRHSFSLFHQAEEYRMVLKGREPRMLGEMTVVLRCGADEAGAIQLDIPIHEITENEFSQFKLRIFGGENKDTFARL